MKSKINTASFYQGILKIQVRSYKNQ